MKVLFFLCLFIISSCALKRGPASHNAHLAHDSMADGKVEAYAERVLQNKNVCFHITLVMKGLEQKDVVPSNWTAAWVDKESRYYLLGLNQRDPASVPQRSGNEWTNKFMACAPNANLEDVKFLILNPKEFSLPAVEGLKFEWN